METTTLWDLAGQPLPILELKGPVFVTIWLFICVAFAYGLWRLLAKEKPTWPEFRPIFVGTLLLALWYLVTVIDQWLHYDQRTMPFGYIIIAPVWEIFRVSSTIILLWGTYTVVWKELEDQFTEKQQGIWWFAAKVSIFLVGLVSFFYVALFLALSIVWMQFLSLNIIADIATKRTDFEVAMTAFFFVFGALTLTAATATIFIQGRKKQGLVRKTRIALWLATLMLFARSTAEFAITVMASQPNQTRHSVLFARQVSYGLLTSLYFAMIYTLAWKVSTGFDTGGRDARRIESNLRKIVLEKLNTTTNGARRQSPPFEVVLQEVESSLDISLSNGSLTSGSTMKAEDNHKAAAQYIQKLRKEYGRLDPKEGADYSSRPASRISEMFGRRTGRRSVGTGGPTPMASNSSMRGQGMPRTTPSIVVPPSAPRRMSPMSFSGGSTNTSRRTPTIVTNLDSVQDVEMGSIRGNTYGY